MEVDGERRQKGRGFRDQTSLADRLEGGTFDRLPSAGSGPGPQKSVEGWVLLVTGVHEEAQEEDLHEAFAEFGDIKNIHLNLDRRSGFVKGYALIEYGSKEEAQAAIDDLDGKELYAKPINVTWAFSTGPLQAKARR